MNRTIQSLVARGFDVKISEKLVSAGFTVQALLKEPDDNLRGLGLSNEFIDRLKKEKRPPIHSNILNTLLMNSAYSCCICRSSNQPIIVHHIIEWSKSKSHDYENLAVLCLNCHAKAHSISTIGINLTPDRILKAKKEWERTVKQREADLTLSKSSWNFQSSIWDYFNHNRIINIVQQCGIDLKKITGFNELYQNGAINLDGSYIWPKGIDKANLQYMYEGGIQGLNQRFADYYSELVKTILHNMHFVDLTYNFKKSTTKLLNVGNLVCVTSGHRFKCIETKRNYGPGQMRKGYKQKDSLLLTFDFDAWETTSSSSHDAHLTGIWRCTSLSIIRNVLLGKKLNEIYCTCLAIGTGFTEYIGKTPRVAYEMDGEEFDATDGGDWELESEQ